MTTKFTRTFQRTFDGTGLDKKTEAGGSYIRLLETTAVLTVNVYKDGEEIANHVGVQQGFAWESIGDDGLPLYFDYVEIASAAAQTVKLAIGAGRAYNDATSGNVTATVVKGTTLAISSATAGAVSSTVLAANTARRRVWMGNTHATDTAYWCEDATAATTGKYPIGPGEEQEIESTDGINAIRGGANNIVLLFREERD